MTKAIVVYYSRFGNTEKIAKALAAGLQSREVETEIRRVEEVKVDEIGEFNLMCVGTPTHAWNISKPVKEFVGHLQNLGSGGGKKAFVFDTKFKSRLAGSAGRKLEKKLKDMGFLIARPAESAIVLGTEGPLEENAEATFMEIGKDLSSLI
ncbi:MAG: flavodoxin family protein [Candidatus Thorarchaeota archaeon]